jgi:WD40 repeat protein
MFLSYRFGYLISTLLLLTVLTSRSSLSLCVTALKASENENAQAGNVSKAAPEEVVLCLRAGGSRDNHKESLSEFACVAYSPDGKMLGTCGYNSSPRLWDAETGKEIRKFEGTDGTVGVIGFSPDGKLLAATGQDRIIHLWNANTGKPIGSLKGHGAWVRSLAFSADGKTLATGDQDKSICIWDMQNRKRNKVLTGCGGLVHALSFSLDGKSLASASDDGKVRLWDIVSGKVVRSWEGKTVVGVAFSPVSNTLAIIGDEGSLWLRDASSGNILQHLKTDRIPEPWWGSVAFSPDGRLLASGSNREFSIWEARTGKLVLTVRRPDLRDLRTERLALSPDCRQLATCGFNDTVLVWGLTGRGKQRHEKGNALTDEELSALWVEIAGADAPRGHRAIWSLVASPIQAIRLMGDKLHPIESKATEAQPWIKQLDDEEFSVRQKASNELAKLGQGALGALRDKLSNEPSEEMKRQIQLLLAKAEAVELKNRTDRAVAVLEYIGSPDAQDVLTSLSSGCESARLTQESKAALTRLSKRGLVNR